MKCDTKTMLTVGLAVGASLAIAYFTLPAAQQLIAAASPFFLFLVCPLSMMLMMKSPQAILDWLRHLLYGLNAYWEFARH